MLGWLWGMLTMMVYLVAVRFTPSRPTYGSPTSGSCWRPGVQMMWRLSLNGAAQL